MGNNVDKVTNDSIIGDNQYSNSRQPLYIHSRSDDDDGDVSLGESSDENEDDEDDEDDKEYDASEKESDDDESQSESESESEDDDESDNENPLDETLFQRQTLYDNNSDITSKSFELDNVSDAVLTLSNSNTENITSTDIESIRNEVSDTLSKIIKFFKLLIIRNLFV